MKSTIKAFVASAIITAGLVGSISQVEAKPSNTYVRDRVVFEVVEINAEENEYGTVPMVVRETYDLDNPDLLGDYPVVDTQVVQVASEPLVIWRETLSSSDPQGSYTPERRAHAVSTRLTNLAESLGIETLEEMYQAGVVNNEIVIFASQEAGDANTDNVVFTLSPGNREQGD
ncbi:MAG: COP23 domain-containing protein, partial [Cyanobacteriota bacterium]|nr:COP23 domain-containing protein [Cyanobacteriota bacterium]